MGKCIYCHAKNGDEMQYGDDNRIVVVRLANSPFGRVCQAHSQNAAKQATAPTKRKSKRQVEHEQMIKKSGQLDMFGSEE